MTARRVDLYIAGSAGKFVAIWSGSLVSIPSGWKLCDGTAGTPDLRDRFVYARNAVVGNSEATMRGGAPTATVQHGHETRILETTVGGEHTHAYDIPDTSGVGTAFLGPTSSNGGQIKGVTHTHAGLPGLTTELPSLHGEHGHGDENSWAGEDSVPINFLPVTLAVNTLPVYLALAYIAAGDASNAPIGSILFWHGRMGVPLPTGWYFTAGQPLFDGNGNPFLDGDGNPIVMPDLGYGLVEGCDGSGLLMQYNNQYGAYHEHTMAEGGVLLLSAGAHDHAGLARADFDNWTDPANARYASNLYQPKVPVTHGHGFANLTMTATGNHDHTALGWSIVFPVTDSESPIWDPGNPPYRYLATVQRVF